ncbi:MAG: hypothetical protein L3J04_09555, partial [Robiginitomaculum sp.]|nr:hypothetical protein [Robiginitomaculum sp.]
MKRNFRHVIFAAGLVAVFSAGFGCTQDHAPAIEPPLGLWVWSADKVKDTLSISIEMVAGDWRAQVDGAAAMTTLNEGIISVTRADSQKFIGKLSNDGSLIHGHWFQPSMPLLNYQDVVTPITLPAVAHGQWQAKIALQP